MTRDELLQRSGTSLEMLQRLLHEYQFALTDEMHAALTDDIADPIAAQFVPDSRELEVLPQELADPIGDDSHSPLATLVHRYPNRVLWKVSPVCAVYCRFCFRKEHIGRRGHALTVTDTQAVARYLAAHTEVEEVILSGGDPLMLDVRKLQQYSAVFRDLPHIRRLRIHTRMPVVQPESINTACLAWLEHMPQSVHIVLHINHSNELTLNACAALRRLRTTGALLFSQTVLLKGINADADTLAALMNNLLDNGVAPYYLHHLDLARGSSHFRVSLEEGREIEKLLRKKVSGIAMPTYIVEIPCGGGKVPVQALSAAQEDKLRALGIY
ncbi:MAG: KamA family radical SAM protein [Cardiobacteriaceae bacterium]|nr:KamA family radical SAM protein [Cardiobacteriaceae bacterium]